MNFKKYLLGFAVFMAYYLIAENIKNKVAAVGKLTNFGA
jgi:hypothetical protein